MRKILFFLLTSCALFAQNVETIEFKGSIKDKKGLIKSLIILDNRPDKEVGRLTYKEEFFEIRFKNEDLKSYLENWFLESNTSQGSSDMVVMLEDLKFYDEQDEGQKSIFGKAKIKISSFIKRNDKYYFINRYENIIVGDQKKTNNMPRVLAENIADILAEFIRVSYTNTVLPQYIPEKEINNYDNYLSKNYKAYHAPELRDGVYADFKSFSLQEPNFGYYTVKNKKGNVVKIKNKDEQVPWDQIFGYVEGGKSYRLTPVGFLEMHKNEKGFYIEASRADLFNKSNGGGIIVGAMAGGVVGALIGAAIDSGNNKGAINGIGHKSTTMSNVYIDSLTGRYIFEK